MSDKAQYQVPGELSTYNIGTTFAYSTDCFFNCHYGFYSDNYYHMHGDSSYIITTQNIYNGYTGSFGYDAVSGI